MEYTQEQLSADLLEMKSALEKEFETKADSKITEKLVEVNAAIQELKDIKPEVTAVELKQIKDDLATTIKAFDLLQTRVKFQGNGEQKSKSFNDVLKDALVENSDKIEKMSRKDSTREKSFSINLDLKAVGDVTLANYTGGTRGLTELRPGIVTNANRKVHMRDIIPTGQIGAGTEYVFMKENGAGEGAIAPVAEGATKPQFDLDLVEASVKIETIAGWMRVTRKAMNNILGFTSFLQMRLPQLMLNVEDTQTLTGDGVSPNLKGIQTAGNFTAAAAGSGVKIEDLVIAIGQLEGLNRTANGIVLNTADYYDMLLNKAAGSGEYNLPNVITVDALGVLRIMGITVVHTTAQTAGTYLVGDFESGVQLLFQENMKIEFFEQDGDNVRTNKVTVRIEETVALPVFGATYFVKGTF